MRYPPQRGKVKLIDIFIAFKCVIATIELIFTTWSMYSLYNPPDWKVNGGTHLEQVCDKTIIGYLEYGSLSVFVNSYDNFAVLHSSQVLDGTRYSYGYIQFLKCGKRNTTCDILTGLLSLINKIGCVISGDMTTPWVKTWVICHRIYHHLHLVSDFRFLWWLWEDDLMHTQLMWDTNQGHLDKWVRYVIINFFKCLSNIWDHDGIGEKIEKSPRIKSIQYSLPY